MARPRLQIHPVGFAFVVFGLLAWVIALGGVGASTYGCQQVNTYEYCAKTSQWQWWSIWLEAALLLALAVSCWLERAFVRGRAVFLAFFVLATQCLMEAAHDALTEVTLGPVDLRDVAQDAVNASAAGFVLLCIANFAILVVIGRDFGVPDAAGAAAFAGGRAAAYNAYAVPSGGMRGGGGGAGGLAQFQTSPPI